MIIELQKNENGHNTVTFFMWYMYNKWSLEESKRIYGDNLGEHIYNKWVEVVGSCNGDNLRFYANLDTKSRNLLVQRALDVYNFQ